MVLQYLLLMVLQVLEEAAGLVNHLLHMVLLALEVQEEVLEVRVDLGEYQVHMELQV